MDKNDKIPCCAADAMRRIRRVNVEGTPVGFAMLDSVIAEVAALGLPSEVKIRDALITRVKIYNYVPPGAVERYADALMKEYYREVNSHGKN
jgi:hypothetical protein